MVRRRGAFRAAVLSPSDHSRLCYHPAVQGGCAITPHEDGETLAGFLRGDPPSVRLLDTWIACAAAPFRRRFAADWPDALQDIRLELLCVLRAGRWRGDARLKTYVWRVAAHTCIDRLRRQRRQPLHEPASDDPEVVAGDPSPLDRVVAASGHRALLEALEAVPAECRELWNRILRGESYREISQGTGVAEGALRVRAHRCRKKAVDALGGRVAAGDDVRGGNAAGAADANG